MKETIKATMTPYINTLLADAEGLYRGKEVARHLTSILDYLMDIPEERTKEDIKIGLVDLSETMSPGEIEDIANHIARATMEVQKKCMR